jgi:hypothetical protein
MSTNTITPQEKKLKDLRKILTICFIGISISIFLLASLPAFLIDARTAQSVEGTPIEVLMTVFVVGLLIMIGVTGVVCLVIYYIFKYRLEKDDELFL